MKADATITEKTIKLEKKKKRKEKKPDQSSTVCQALKKAARQILSQNHNKKKLFKTYQKFIKRKQCKIYELQKIMNTEVPLNVQHLKTYELKKKHEYKGSFYKCP